MRGLDRRRRVDGSGCVDGGHSTGDRRSAASVRARLPRREGPGVAYLLFVGAQSLRAAWRDRANHGEPITGSPRPTSVRAWRQGAISNLANPKMAAFFVSLLPQFAPDGPASFAVMAGLGLLFSGLTFLWLAAYSLAVARARRLLTRPRVRRTVDGLAGVVLITLGVRLAFEPQT